MSVQNALRLEGPLSYCVPFSRLRRNVNQNKVNHLKYNTNHLYLFLHCCIYYRLWEGMYNILMS